MRAGESKHIPKVLVVGQIPATDSRKVGDAARFEALAKTLSLGGLDSAYVMIRDTAGMEWAFERYDPELVFCSFFRFRPSRHDAGSCLRDYAINSGIAWVGSHTDALELALSKPRMKAQWLLEGVPTPDWFTVRKYKDGSIDGLELIENARDFPYIVKPANEGNSRGIDELSIVRQPLELYSRASRVAEEYGEALVERFVSGGEDSREFTVAMIGNGANAIISAVEVKKTAAESVLVTEGEKERGMTRAMPVDDPKLKERVERLARKAFLSARTRDYARCDILLHEGKLWAIEMNGQPMVPDPWFGACAREAGLDERQYPNAIVLASIIANSKSGYAFIPVPAAMRSAVPAAIFERFIA